MTDLALPRQRTRTRTRIRFARPKLPDSFLTELLQWATGFHFCGSASFDWYLWYVGTRDTPPVIITALWLGFLFWFSRKNVPREARWAKVPERLLWGRLALGSVLGAVTVWIIRTDAPGFYFWMGVLLVDFWIAIRKGPPGSAA